LKKDKTTVKIEIYHPSKREIGTWNEPVASDKIAVNGIDGLEKKIIVFQLSNFEF
jgi:hypothetical protein